MTAWTMTVAGVALVAFSVGLFLPSRLVEARRWLAARDAREDAADAAVFDPEWVRSVSETPEYDRLTAETFAAQLADDDAARRWLS